MRAWKVVITQDKVARDRVYVRACGAPGESVHHGKKPQTGCACGVRKKEVCRWG